MTPDPWCTATRHGMTRQVYRRGCRCTAARAAAAAYERELQREFRAGHRRIVDATGTQRRIHALQRAGWSAADLGARLFVYYTTVQKWSVSPTIMRRNAEAVADLYQQIGLDDGGNEVTRRRAERAGWPPPIEWGPNIDDPKARPLNVDRIRRAPQPLEDIELLVMSGETWERACSRLGVAKEALDRRLHRNGRADLVHRLTANSECGELMVRREFGVYARRSA